jgi:hypothetical protein
MDIASEFFAFGVVRAGLIHSESKLTTDFTDGTDKKDEHSEGFVHEST